MDNEQDLVAAILRATPPPDVRDGFVARVNARIDATAGWIGIADFRVWTLRLAPAAAALALVAAFWSGSTSPVRGASPASVEAVFSPASSSDWQKDVSGEALLEAALAPAGAVNAR